jgi:RNA ligase (TIGR02306 family)
MELYEPGKRPLSIEEGTDVAEFMGFSHYEEPEVVSGFPRTKPQYQSPWRSWGAFKFWVLYKLGFGTPLHGDNAKPPKNTPPTYDVEGFKNYPHTFTEGEEVVVTEKIHGSNARYLFDGKKMHVGSKNLWKSEKSTCIWRRALKELPWIEKVCRAYPNFTLYAEVIPTQKGYAYGTKYEEVKVLAFDLLKPDGAYCHKEDLHDDESALAGNLVPVLYAGPYDEAKIMELVEGKSAVDDKTLREGIVISSAKERVVRGLGRAQLKIKSMKFLEKENKA